MAEQWLPVVGREGRFEVSDEGRVRSLDWVTAAEDASEGLKDYVRRYPL